MFSSGGRVRVFNTIADSTLYAEGATVWESLETLAKCAKNPKHGSTIYATGGYPVSYFDEWVIQGRTTNIFYNTSFRHFFGHAKDFAFFEQEGKSFTVCEDGKIFKKYYTASDGSKVAANYDSSHDYTKYLCETRNILLGAEDLKTLFLLLEHKSKKLREKEKLGF